jgi:hypothetical protein
VTSNILADAQSHCVRRAARYKLPARIVPAAAFPVAKGARGEAVQRARLRERAVRLGQ